MHFRCLVLLTLLLPGAARRSFRVDDARHDARHQGSVEAREAFLPRGFGMALLLHRGLRAGGLHSVQLPPKAAQLRASRDQPRPTQLGARGAWRPLEPRRSAVALHAGGLKAAALAAPHGGLSQNGGEPRRGGCGKRGLPGRRAGGPRASLFPEDDSGDNTAGASSFPVLVIKSPTLSELLSDGEAIGFWKVYDALGTKEMENELKGSGKLPSELSARMVLRADGAISRGSDFPSGEWNVYRQGEGDDALWRMRLVLRSKLLAEEWRYDGMLVGTTLPQPSRAGGSADTGDQSSGGPESGENVVPEVSLIVVGKATRWEMKGDDERLVQNASFSMSKIAVNRSKLIPTIQSFQGPATVDPEELRIQAEWRKLKDESEEDDIRRAIEDIRRAKAEDPDNWMERNRVREGVDFWRAGEEPDIADGTKD